jgi:hypothetical protein
LSLRDALVRGRNRFRAIAPRRKRDLPLIGIVGEIFCRLNTFSNEDLVRSLEAYGAEAWVSDLVEWIWYTNSEHFRKLKLTGRIWTAEALGAWVRKRVQKRDEHVLLSPSRGFRRPRRAGYLRDPGSGAALPAARRRFRRNGAQRGKGRLPGQERRRRYHRYQPVHLHERHRLARRSIRASAAIMGGIPIRNFYFDGTQSDLDRDLGVYMELARRLCHSLRPASGAAKAHGHGSGSDARASLGDPHRHP